MVPIFLIYDILGSADTSMALIKFNTTLSILFQLV